LANQQKLAQNQVRPAAQGPGAAAREGAALLEGLLICGA